MTTTPELRPGRTILGMSAVLLPFTDSGEVDWLAFESLLDRTVAVGITPAVNMDTGYVQLLDEATRFACSTWQLPTRLVPRGAFVAGAFVEDAPGAAFDLDAYLAADRRDLLARRRLPSSSRRMDSTRLDDAGWVDAHDQLGARVDRFIGFELGPMFVPYGRSTRSTCTRPARDLVSASARSTRRCSRELEWDRLALRDRGAPRLPCLHRQRSGHRHGVYGSDYLLGLSAFAPEAFAERDRRWARRRARLPRAERSAAVPRLLRVPAAGAGVQARRRAVPARSAAASPRDATPAGATRRPASDRDVLRRHRSASRGDPVTDIVQVKRLRTIGRTPRPPRGPRHRRAARIDDVVEPDGVLARPFTFTDGSAGTVDGRQPVRGAADGGLGRHRRRAPDGSRPPALASASARAAPSSSGAARPSRCVTTAAPTRTNSSSTTRHLGELAALRNSWWPRTWTRIGRTTTCVVGLQLTHSGRWCRPTGEPRATHRASPPRARRSGARRTLTRAHRRRPRRSGRRPRRRRGARGRRRLRLRRRQALPRLPRPRAARRGRPSRRVRRVVREPHHVPPRVVEGIRPEAPGLAIGVRLSRVRLRPVRCGTGRCRASPPTAQPTRPDSPSAATAPASASTSPRRTGSSTCVDELGIGLVCITGGQPVLQPAHPAARVLPAVRRLHAARRPAGRRGPHDRGDRRAATMRIPMSRSWSARATRTSRSGCRTSPSTRCAPAARLHRHRPRDAQLSASCPADVLAGRPLDATLLCRTFSDCTTAPRNGLVSGCYPLDHFYKDMPERRELAAIKKQQRRATRR